MANHIAVPTLEALNVFNVGLATDGEARGFEPSNAKLHSLQGHDLDSLSAQVFCEPRDIEHSLRNRGPELCFTGENNNRLDGAGRQEFKEVLHCLNVSKVLDYWILKLEAVPEQDLGPVLVLRVGEEPTLVVLGFKDENAEPGNEDVINLGCSVLHRQGDVIHQVIIRKTKGGLHDAGGVARILTAHYWAGEDV